MELVRNCFCPELPGPLGNKTFFAFTSSFFWLLGDGRWQEGAQAEPVLVEVFRVTLQPRWEPGPGDNLQPEQCWQLGPLPGLQPDPAVRQCSRHRAAPSTSTPTAAAATALPFSSQFRISDVDALAPAVATEHREGERHRVHPAAAAAHDEHDHTRPQSNRFHFSRTRLVFHSVSIFFQNWNMKLKPLKIVQAEEGGGGGNLGSLGFLTSSA